MREAEAKRLEELGCRLRSKRQEAAERKKEREVKLTDRIPPPKRLKNGCTFMPNFCNLARLADMLHSSRGHAATPQVPIPENTDRSFKDTEDHVQLTHATPDAGLQELHDRQVLLSDSAAATAIDKWPAEPRDHQYSQTTSIFPYGPRSAETSINLRASTKPIKVGTYTLSRSKQYSN